LLGARQEKYIDRVRFDTSYQNNNNLLKIGEIRPLMQQANLKDSRRACALLILLNKDCEMVLKDFWKVGYRELICDVCCLHVFVGR